MPVQQRELKVFDVSVLAPEDEDLIPFALRFVFPDGHDEMEEFTAYAAVGAQAALALARLQRPDGKGRVVMDLAQIESFLENTMPAADWARLSEMLDNNHQGRVTMEQLAAVFAYLCEEQSGRPLRVLSPSSGGRGSTGRSSTVAASSRA